MLQVLTCMPPLYDLDEHVGQCYVRAFVCMYQCSELFGALRIEMVDKIRLTSTCTLTLGYSLCCIGTD